MKLCVRCNTRGKGRKHCDFCNIPVCDNCSQGQGAWRVCVDTTACAATRAAATTPPTGTRGGVKNP